MPGVMDEEVLQKLAAASTPEEVQACLAEKGLELVAAGPPKAEGPPKEKPPAGFPPKGGGEESSDDGEGGPVNKLSRPGLERTAEKAFNSQAQKPPRKRGANGY